MDSEDTLALPPDPAAPLSEPERVATAPEAVERRSPLRLALITALTAFAAGLAAMALVIWHYAPFAMGTPVPEAKPGLVAVPAASIVTPPPGTDLASLSAREQELATRLSELESRLAMVDGSARTASAYATRAESLFAVLAARRAIDRGLQLGYVEQELRERFGGTEPDAVANVIAASRDKVTREDLRLALDNLAPTLVSGGASEGWWRSLSREIRNLVVVRQATTPSPRPSDGLDRARRMLDAGNAEAALAEVARLPGAPDADGWINAAKRYIATRDALNDLERAALQGRTGAAPDGAAPTR